MERTTLITIAVAALAVSVGCNKPQGTSSQSQATGAATSSSAETTGAVDAHELVQTRCVPCHGTGGKGDGPGAAALNPKPRNYTDPKWQESVTDEQIKKTILYGGAAVGKSPNMPANPDLEGKPELDGLVQVVREFKGK